MEISGIIKKVDETQQVTDSFKKREFVLSTQEQYPQHISFQFVQDRCEKLNGIQPNDEVKVFFDIRGREWTSPQGEVKYFNTLQAWNIEKMTAGGATASDSLPTDMPEANPPADGGSDDLPF